MKYPIKYNSSSPTKTFEVNQNEELFFDKLYDKLTPIENQKIILYRMSNGTLSPYYNGFPFGKIKLQGKKHSMQILKSLYKFDDIDGTVDDFIEKIDDMIKYLRKHCK